MVLIFFHTQIIVYEYSITILYHNHTYRHYKYFKHKHWAFNYNLTSNYNKLISNVIDKKEKDVRFKHWPEPFIRRPRGAENAGGDKQTKVPFLELISSII